MEAFAFIPPGVVLEDEVFVGPHVCFTNDKYPKATGEWEKGETLVRKGASVGANATVVCGVTIGEGAMVTYESTYVPKAGTVEFFKFHRLDGESFNVSVDDKDEGLVTGLLMQVLRCEVERPENGQGVSG